jgi:hypothetical protein
MPVAHRFWYQAGVEEGTRHQKIFEHVSQVESDQSDLFERFVQYAVLYDPHDRQGRELFLGAAMGQVYENVCATGVDSITAIIARQKPIPRFITEGGDWTAQRTAKQLEHYAKGLSKKLKLHTKCQRAFKDAAIKGTGLLKVSEGGPLKVRVERVPVDEIIVDEGECIAGEIRQLHQRKIVNRTVLAAEFPEHEDEIYAAEQTSDAGRYWADYRPLDRDQIVIIESWYLPTDDGAPGRHCISLENADLLDEEWTKPFFPFVRFVFSERSHGWYGISLIERIAGHQRVVNKRHLQIDRTIDHHAFPTTWVQQADAALAVKSVNRFGTLGVYKASKPETVQARDVSREIREHLAETKAGAYEEAAISKMTATASKPAGLDSGAALREYRDATTERYALIEQAYEEMFLDVIMLVLDVCKDLGKRAPEITHTSKFGPRVIKWRDVDMKDVAVQIAAANNLSDTPAGRKQAVIEWAQAGIISTDDARRLLNHPDLERAMSLYTAALEDIERTIEELLDGETLVPEPYQNLKMGVWRTQMAYLKAIGDGAPEEILEGLRTWIVQAAHLVAPPPQPAPAGMGPQPVQTPLGPVMPPAGPMDPSLGPPMAPPQAAFSPQAMTVQPSYG